MNTAYIDNYIKEHYSAKRTAHTYGVRDTAVRLAKKYGADPEKAEIAALYHDMFRRASDEQIDAYIRDKGLPKRFRGDPDLAHGKIAAIFMKEEQGIEDEDILNAVAYHTTGREGMSKLEKVIYLADAIEPNRDYTSVGIVRKAADEDLDRGCLEILERADEYLSKKGRTMDRDSIEALEWLRKEVMTEELSNHELAREIASLLDMKKAEDVRIIDVTGKSSFADYLILASAGSERQAEALADDAEDKMAELGQNKRMAEGKKSGWILLDFGDIIVNVFSKEMRSRYDLEKVWGDCEMETVCTGE